MRVRSILVLCGIGLLILTPAQAQSPQVAPPLVPETAIEGGRVVLDAAVADDGRIEDVTVLIGTPPFTQPTVAAVRTWRLPTAELGEPPYHALVAAAFRPPALTADWVAQAASHNPAPPGIPVPSSMPIPDYPIDGLGSVAVVVEVEISAGGAITGARVLTPDTGAFGEQALTAARRWSFRPARTADGPTDATAYIIFGFTRPLIGAPPEDVEQVAPGEDVEAPETLLPPEPVQGQ